MLSAGMLALFLTLPPFSPVSVSSCLLVSVFAVWLWPLSLGLCPPGAPGTMRAKQNGNFSCRASAFALAFARICQSVSGWHVCLLLRSPPRVPASMLAMLLCGLLVGFQSLSTLVDPLCRSRSPCPEGVALYGLRL